MASSSVPEVDFAPGQPRIRGLQNDSELTKITTKHMVGTLEWTAPFFQMVALFISAIYDPFISYGRAIIFGVVGAHLLLVPFYYRGYGPFARGGWWIVACFFQVIFVNGLLAVMSQPDTYGNHIVCVPGCNYSGTFWLFLGFYPWLPQRLNRWRALFELLMLAAYFFYFLSLAWLNNGDVSQLNIKTAGTSFLWLLIAYLFGKAIGKMCVAAAQKQLEVQQQNFDAFFDFLHSHVKSGIASIRKELSDPRRVKEKLDELETTIGSYRVELLLVREQVPLAALFSERIRTFTGVLDMKETPRLGPMTVNRPVGMLIGRALGDLLSNSAKYGAKSVRIRCESAGGVIVLEIADDGPGFDGDVFDDESRSLHRLRCAARDLGGDLTMHPGEDAAGAVLTLVAPLHAKKR
ncbi:hypothetical protein [Nonomuraea sp. NPDC049480]|uniref:hypothetical protein n=1 Tax=Nonomuraea sp. NPDC049480 TaxID=3364353 RepID=UPI003793242B